MLPFLFVKIADIIGPLLVIMLSFMIVYEASKIKSKVKGINVWYFIYWFAVAEVIFAIARSVGHILKHLFVSQGVNWKIAGAFSGSLNTITFVIVFVVSLITAESIKQFGK